MPYILENIARELKKEYSKLKHKRFWIGLTVLLVTSLVIAINFPKNDAVREMATGAFSGGIIGWIILWYEQIREDERDNKQDERSKKQARILRKEADLSADVRNLAESLRLTIKPSFYETFGYGKNAKHSDFRNSYKFYTELESYQVLVNRINDSMIKIKYNQIIQQAIKTYEKVDTKQKHSPKEVVNQLLDERLLIEEKINNLQTYVEKFQKNLYKEGKLKVHISLNTTSPSANSD